MNDAIVRTEQILSGFQQNGLNYINYLASTSSSDEAVVRLKIVEPLLEALGYDLQKDLVPEHRAGDNAIDLLVKAEGIPTMVWELKRTQDQDLTQHREQLSRYVLTQGVTHGMLCNGREVRVYQRVGDRLRFSYAFPLTVFAPGTPTAPSRHDEQALDAFFDAFNRDTFLEIEHQKQDIIGTRTPPLVLEPHQPQNEKILIDALKREIRRLHRFVVLRFHSHRNRYSAFIAQRDQLSADIDRARDKLKQRLETFAQQFKQPVDWSAMVTYLETFQERWTDVKEDDFVAEGRERTGVAQHLNGVHGHNVETSLVEFYRAFTHYTRWHAQQRVKLRSIRTLIEDFEHWREEIGVMAEDPESEFCLQTVYIFVTRLLLIRICEDKELITQKISDGGYKNYLDFSQRFFSNVAGAHATLLDLAYQDTSYIYGHFFSRDVFDWYDWEEETIVRLFWTLHRFDFERVSADLIGRIYEQYVDELERKRKGQFYTPPQVVNYILDQVTYDGPQIIGTRVLDPACGSGRFLVEAARRLVRELKAHARDDEPKDLVNERLRNSLFGMDVNRFACFLAEVNLLVQVLDLLKGTPGFTIDRFHIYPTNTLLSREHPTVALIGPGNGIGYESEVAELIKSRGYNPGLGLDFREGFDYVVGNPPYVRADSPGVSKLRSRIDASGQYETLYKKWDLYIPFIEFAIQVLADGGKHSFIVSDAYQTEEYGRWSREFLLEETTIENLTFAPGMRFFEEAQVHNLIYAVRKVPPGDDHHVARYTAVAESLQPQDLQALPDLLQTKWGEQIFRPAFKGDDGLDFSGCLALGDICYVSYGLRPLSADDAPTSFSREEILSPDKRGPYTKRFVEGKDIQPYYIEAWQWLEWGTTRVPAYLYRKTFSELYTSPKIIVGETSGVYYDRNGELYDDHSTRNVVPYYEFSLNAKEYVARVMAREISDEDIAALDLSPAERSGLSKTALTARVIDARADVSQAYDLRYLTALLNCRWLQRYMMAFVRRGSRRRFYPDDLKQWPIAPADTETQSRLARLVDEIMNAKEDIQNWRDQGHPIDEEGIALNPRPFLDTWNIHHGDLIDAAGFLTYEINGHITTIEREGQRLIFRKLPLSYIESPHDSVLDYLALYLETNQEALRAEPVTRLAAAIRTPRSPSETRQFLTRLEAERERVMLRWMVAAQRENLIEAQLFDLYDVEDDQREELSGPLHTLKDIPGNVKFVSILVDEEDTPMRRVAFYKDGGWYYRTEAALSDVVRVWMHDGREVKRRHAVIGPDHSIVVT